jgi:hypothetical protein
MSDSTSPGTTEHHVSPADIRNLLAGEGGVDLRPIIKHGKQVAMRVVGVTPGTTAARLGAQNDDSIESINEMPMTSVTAAYKAGDVAVRERRIVIRGERAGEAYVTVLVL